MMLRSNAFTYLSFDHLRVYPQTPEAVEDLRKSSSEGYEVIVNLLRADPIPHVSESFGQSWLEGFFGPTFQPAIHSMTVGELRRYERHLSLGRKMYSRRWIDQIDAAMFGGEPIVYKGKPWINRPLYESHNCNLTENLEETRAARKPGFQVAVNVDIQHSDAFLIDAFKDWLKKVRCQEALKVENRKFGKQETQSWVKYNVLAFLDLQLWAQEKDVSIPHRVMADAIFRPWEMDAETIRKTVVPLAWSLIAEPEDGGGSALAWLAAQEG